MVPEVWRRCFAAAFEPGSASQDKSELAASRDSGRQKAFNPLEGYWGAEYFHVAKMKAEHGGSLLLNGRVKFAGHTDNAVVFRWQTNSPRTLVTEQKVMPRAGRQRLRQNFTKIVGV